MITFLSQYRVFRHLLNAMHVQLFISVASLPLLIAWGFPLSLSAPLGNFLFTPFLTVFLLCSSFIFFFELCNIPNTWLITALEYIHGIWTYFLGYEQLTFSFACMRIATPWLFVLVVAVMAILHLRILRAHNLCWVALLCLYCTTVGGLWWCSQGSSVRASLTCAQGTITAIRVDGKTILVDPGCLGGRGCSTAYCLFNIVPFIIQTTGSLQIDHCVVLRINRTTMQCLAAIQRHIKIKKLYIADNDENRKCITSTHAASLVASGVDIQYVSQCDKIITTKAGECVQLLVKEGIKNKGMYRLWGTSGLIDKQPFTIYAANHKYIKIKGLHE